MKHTEEQRKQAERARRWLGRYRWVAAEVELLEDTIQNLREAYDRISSAFAALGVASGSPGDKVADAAEKTVTAEEQLVERLAEKSATLAEIEHTLDKVENDLYRVMLKQYFIGDCKTWPEVAASIDYSEAHTYHIVTDALLSVALPGENESSQ